MRIGLISGEYPPMQGGVGDYTNELSKALAALGVAVSVITSVKGQGTGHLSLFPNIEKWDWRCWRGIMSIARDVRADILHIQYQAAAYGMHPAINFLPLRMRLASAGHPRTVVTFHDLRVPYLFPKAGPLRWQVVLALARGSDAVVVTNEKDRWVLEGELKGTQRHPAGLGRVLSRPRLFLIPIGSNIKPVLPAGYDRAAQRARWGMGPDDILLCHFGFMNERKGIETLLHALKALTNEASPAGDLRLLMIGGKVGSSDPTNVAYLRRVEGLIAELGLTERVLWTDFVSPEEVTACFAAADVCVLPYREGASFQHGTLMAALAHGVPIVTTGQTANSKLQTPKELRDGENMVLVPPDDAQALAAAIRTLAGSPELRRRLGEGARELSRLFDWERIAAQHLEVYRALA